MVLNDSESEEGNTMEEEEEENLYEDEMFVSAATRMSIMGVRPKDMASDESDFIQSDEVLLLFLFMYQQ